MHHPLLFFLPFQWPPLVEVAETRQLPPMLIERYNAAAGEGTALCGIFSDIHRAWATVDNSFFVWRFDKWLVSVSLFSWQGLMMNVILTLPLRFISLSMM